jgi:hypothetical protein
VKKGAVIAALCFAEQILSVLTFHGYCSIWKDFGTTGLHVKLMCVCEFVKIWAEERTLRMGNEWNFIDTCTVEAYDSIDLSFYSLIITLCVIVPDLNVTTS